MQVEPDVERMYTRIQFDRNVDVEFISNKHRNCAVKDISLSGMYVYGDFANQKEKNCHVELFDFSNDGTVQNLPALAKVVRKEEGGMGVEFISMPHDSYMFLQTSLLNGEVPIVRLSDLLMEDCPFEISDQPS